MACQMHTWKLTGRSDQHTKGGVPDLFKKPQRVVHFVRCQTCKQDGFKYYFDSGLVFTWSCD